MNEYFVELWRLLKERKKFWLLPIIICLVLLGSLIVLNWGIEPKDFIASEY